MTYQSEDQTEPTWSPVKYVLTDGNRELATIEKKDRLCWALTMAGELIGEYRSLNAAKRTAALSLESKT